MALVILFEKKITEASDNSEFAICILIDFRKAFDTVEHNILLQNCIIMELEEMLSNGLIVTFQIDTNMSITTILLLILH